MFDVLQCFKIHEPWNLWLHSLIKTSLDPIEDKQIQHLSRGDEGEDKWLDWLISGVNLLGGLEIQLDLRSAGI